MDGWWTDLAVPPPLDEQVSGILVGPAGREIPVVNGSPELEQLLGWGMDRFTVAGLDEPQIDSVTFAPVRACAGRAGMVSEDDDGGNPDLVLCTSPYEVCKPDLDSCSEFSVTSRFGLLHELAHVWHLDYLDEESQVAFMEFSDTNVWRSGAGIPWHQRGAEQAAEMMAWGLMDEPVMLVRLDDPACERAAAGFKLLTGREPLQACNN